MGGEGDQGRKKAGRGKTGEEQAGRGRQPHNKEAHLINMSWGSAQLSATAEKLMQMRDDLMKKREKGERRGGGEGGGGGQSDLSARDGV